MKIPEGDEERKTTIAEKGEMALIRASAINSSFIIFSLFILHLIISLHLTPRQPSISRLQTESPPEQIIRKNIPKWYEFVSENLKEKKYIKIGLVNTNRSVINFGHGLIETVTVQFDHVPNDLKWEDFFPNWIDEDERFRRQRCPEIPIPGPKDYRELDVVVAEVPCGNTANGKGVRDVVRLQVNLVVANLVVWNGWKDFHQADRTVYVVFMGPCGPMWEIFRCDDLVYNNERDVLVYKPDLRRMKQKVLMPVGSCRIAPPIAESGKEEWRRMPFGSKHSTSFHKQKEAYVTVLHSSQTYVCGAIALAQSILQTNTTKDLVLLADDSISKKSVRGLKAAGWKIKRIKRIKSPHAEKGAYNEWNYSKLRIWQLTEYDKVIFIDADLIVLINMDIFFLYPQLSAAWNDKFLFNSGVMLVEPSKCMFKTLMEKRFTFASYNGGDQGFLNEGFTWWHRWHSNVNHLKVVVDSEVNPRREMPENVYAIHYLGLKPWMCYKDYDCNWDMLDHHPFASDSAHRKWWKVYDAMPEKLKPYCALTKRMDERLRKLRGRAKNASFPDEHWKVKVRDPRRQCL